MSVLSQFTGFPLFDGDRGNITVSASGQTWTIDNGVVTNAMLQNSTISGVALGSNLNSITFNNGGAGAASGTTFNGSSAVTVSYNTVGAPSTTGTNASGTWGINITGNAATATSATSATNAQSVYVSTSSIANEFKVPFASTTASTTGYYGLHQDSTATFTYNPSTNTLTAGTFSGSLSGNATTATSATSATSATNATNATNVALTTSATASEFKVPFANTTVSTTGNYGLLQDDTATFTYNPSTNTLTLANLSSTGSITSSGNITAYSSDGRLKENLKHLENPIEKIQSLNGYTFDWNEKSKELGFVPKHEKGDIGLIAQEVESVLPQAVAPAPFDHKRVEEGLVSKSGENYLTIQYERLVPLLVEAIKEQQNQINQLKAQIEGMK